MATRKPRLFAADGTPIKRGAVLYQIGNRTLGVRPDRVCVVGYSVMEAYKSRGWDIPEQTWLRVRHDDGAVLCVHPSTLYAEPKYMEDR